MKMALVIGLVILFIGGYWYLEIKVSGRRRLLEAYNSGDLDGFLEHADVEIRRAATGKIRDFLLLHKAEALFYKGDTAGSTGVLNEIDPVKLTKEFLPYYYKLQLENLLLSDNLEDARKLYNQRLRNILEGNGVPPLQFRFTKAIYEFYTGDLNASKDTLQQLTGADITPMCQAVVYYFLGQIEKVSGNVELSGDHLREAVRLGQNTFVAQRV